MTTPPDWSSPDADEPIPASPPGGSTDADLGGIDVTHEYADVDGLLATVASGWAAVLAYARSFLGTYPPGRLRENVNQFTLAYYANQTAAAWCLIFVWYVLKHFGLATWKLAYVPWLYKIPGEKNGHAGIEVGAICAISGFSHVGFYVASHGDYFDLLSGNSTSGSSSDAITVKRYPKSVISGHVNVNYSTSPSTSGDDPMIGLKKGDKGEPVKALQLLIEYAGRGAALGKSGVDGEYGSATAEALRLVRKDVGSDAKAGYGDKVTGWAYGQLMAAVARKQGHA